MILLTTADDCEEYLSAWPRDTVADNFTQNLDSCTHISNRPGTLMLSQVSNKTSTLPLSQISNRTSMSTISQIGDKDLHACNPHLHMKHFERGKL
eukprot:353222-Chlamydomonas_euryale.AAC.5